MTLMYHHPTPQHYNYPINAKSVDSIHINFTPIKVTYIKVANYKLNYFIFTHFRVPL